jgi:hypothetical protein
MVTQLQEQDLCQTEKLLKDLRKTPLFTQVIPLEAGIGLPIPLRKNNKVYAILPCFEFAATQEKGKTLIFPPLATITVNWETQKLVEYIDLQFRNPAPDLQWEGSIGTFPHDAVAAMTRKEYLEKRRQLLEMYDELFAKLKNNEKFAVDWNQKFRELFSTLIEPPLITYYRALGNKFCEQFLS